MIDPAPGPTSRIEIVGRVLLTIGCTDPTGALSTCGAHTDRGWEVERTSGAEIVDVIAQVNLPPAG